MANRLTFDEAIAQARALGFGVNYSEEHDGWVVITPARFRRPSEIHGSWGSERAAWRGAAFLAAYGGWGSNGS